ncbi:MAG: DUF3784 domain-containing protein [Clostridium sp.]|uniref:DUF3784 domain-containing protein n=1 Tax=Clostridium sp. TaxID=1506 RepID=UPI0025BB7C57|nr:DUF3784 domain-containing protein [Clostridium sp.]MCF0148578.1 DUF3784 domain-containing protein [Clostridium sp.]
MLVEILVIGFFVILGIILSIGKGSFLIAGFNIMSKEEKEKYDSISLSKFMGKFMFIIAICITLFLLSDIFMLEILFNMGLTLFWISLIFVIIYANTGNRFKKK